MKNSIIVFFFLLVVSCKNEELPKESASKRDSVPVVDSSASSFYKINEIRTKITQNDTFKVWPYEFYANYTFQGLKNLSTINLEFTYEDTDSLVYFSDDRNEFGELHKKGENFILLRLQNSEGEYLNRELIPGNRYKIIYAYFNDSESLRSLKYTTNNSGYYIVDLVPDSLQFSRD